MFRALAKETSPPALRPQQPPNKPQMASPVPLDPMLRRAQGCLLGQLADDALGSQVELMGPEEVRPWGRVFVLG